MALTYQQLVARQFRVSSVEAAGIRHTTERAQVALTALQTVVDADPYADDIQTLNATLQALRARIIPAALLTVETDDDFFVE